MLYGMRRLKEKEISKNPCIKLIMPANGLASRQMDWLRAKFELPHSLRPMEGLRGFAVALVFLVHYVSLSRSTDAVHTALHGIGNSGVDLFFVLSGFLIYGSLIRRSQAFPAYMRRRVERIYPAFLAVFAIYLAISVAVPHRSKIEGPLHVVQNLLLLPGIFDITPIITVAWSLSYEMFFYLVVPALVTLLALRSRSRRWRVTFIGSFALCYWLYCLRYGGHPRLLMFCGGMLLCEAVQARIKGPPDTLAAVLAIAGLLAMLTPRLQVPALFVAFPFLCLACFNGGWLSRLFSWTPMRWLGNMSYSYYLMHGLALQAAFMLVDVSSFWLGLPVMFAWTLLPSALLFLLVERPFSLVEKPARSKARSDA